MKDDDLQTLAERSGYRQTGRIEEVEALCEAFARAGPMQSVRSSTGARRKAGRCGRCSSRVRAPVGAGAGRSGIPLLMIQAGIHPGESDGKDAGFIALRELLERHGRVRQVLEQIAVLFVPAFNTDGHERVGRWNRPNQNGPGGNGLAHDRAESESQSRLHQGRRAGDAGDAAADREWDPLVCADLHVTDGADFEPDISIQVEPINQGDAEPARERRAAARRADRKLAAQGSLPLPFYPDLAKTDDPASGFVLTVYSPRFSTGYFPQRNRFTVLVETHSWKPYEQRVRVTRNTILGLVQS